ncbi:uncharacterized protein LOC143297426 [Babylonia areolata]|uniref:uncharacterized protein LOC143297426 n=1 Tax=Babylonia areolata TaxID=304850 RepID=UPI003FD046A5
MEGNGGGDEKMATFSNGCLAEEVAVAKRPTMILFLMEKDGTGEEVEEDVVISGGDGCPSEESLRAKCGKSVGRGNKDKTGGNIVRLRSALTFQRAPGHECDNYNW